VRLKARNAVTLPPNGAAEKSAARADRLDERRRLDIVLQS
jgi:hypothetical protein